MNGTIDTPLKLLRKECHNYLDGKEPNQSRLKIYAKPPMPVLVFGHVISYLLECE